MEGAAEVGGEVDERAGGGGVDGNPAVRVESGPEDRERYPQ
jgi:hypothetical protein